MITDLDGNEIETEVDPPRIRIDDIPPWPDYRDLVSEEDWNKYYEGRQYMAYEPLVLALIRALEKQKPTEQEQGDD